MRYGNIYFMETYKRPQLHELLSLLTERPREIIFITGPRQAGKTTLAQQAMEQIRIPYQYVLLDEPDTSASLSSSGPIARGLPRDGVGLFRGKRDTGHIIRLWEDARAQAIGSESGFVLVLDEIQKVQDWSPTVKGLWDADRRNQVPLHVVLLGSAPLLMQKGMNQESMLGRYITIPVPHWSFEEMRDAFGFDLEQYVYFGGYPGGAAHIHEQKLWRRFVSGSIIVPNIERDILAMERVDNPTLLKRLFELGAAYSGQILAYNKMLGELQGKGNAATLIRYLDLLSKASLITGLKKYSNAPHLRKQSHPKLNVLNTSFMSTSTGATFEQTKANESFWGRLVESAVGAHLYNTKDSTDELYYWRDNETGFEVDFILKRGFDLVAVEVKSKKEPYPPALTEFKRRFDNVTPVHVGEGGISLGEFLSIPACDLPEEL